MAEKKATYIIAEFSMSEVFKMVSENVKAKAKAEGLKIPEGNIISIVNTGFQDIVITVWYYNGQNLNVVFKETPKPEMDSNYHESTIPLVPRGRPCEMYIKGEKD